MRCTPIGRDPARCAIFGTALLLALASPAMSDDAAPLDAMHGALDGMSFVGRFGPSVGPLDREDALTFGGGQFWSAICVPCGFLPSTYWIRRIGDTIHFRGEMDSVDRGRFQYAGVIRGKQMSATVKWRKERWYWSIDRDFRFEGRLTEAAVTDSVAAVTQRASRAAVKPEPDVVCRL